MGLANYKPPTVTITVGGTSFTVRGLSLNDLSQLVATHYEDLQLLGGLYKKSAEEGEAFEGQFYIEIARNMPGLLEQAIALVIVDEPDATVGDLMQGARNLGVAGQVAAITEIGRLSFEEAGGIKNFLTSVVARLGIGLNLSPTPRTFQNTPSTDGTTTSEGA